MRQTTERVLALEEEAPTPAAALVGVTVRGFVLVVLLTLFTYLVISRLGFMQLVPPVPALILLLVLVICNKLVAVLARAFPLGGLLRPLSRGELLLIYVALSIAPVMDRGVYVLHYLLYPIYYGNDVNQWREFAQYYPSFYIPETPAIAQGFWEGSASGLLEIVMNVLWWVFGGVEAAVVHLVLALILAITIVGLPFARQHIKLLKLALVPFGARVE